MSTIKPKAEWRVGMSIFTESTGEGQISWRGDGRDGRPRLQVVFIRNKRTPNKFYRSAVVRGSAAEAVKVLEQFREEFEATQPKTAPAAAPAAAVRVPRSRRKHPNTVLTGHANSERHWKQQYEALVAEAPPRPPAPAGLPPLKPRIRMRSGRVVETSSPVWKVDRDFTSNRRIILNIDRLHRPWALGVKNPGGLLGGIPRRESRFSGELKHAVSLFVARTLERRTGGQALRILAELIQFEAFLAAQNPEQVFGPSELSERVYRAFARTPATVRGHFVAFYGWCVGQGFAGFDIQILMRLRRVPTHSGVRGKAIRSSNPRKGALVWEEQQLLTRALAAPAPQTHPRDGVRVNDRAAYCISERLREKAFPGARRPHEEDSEWVSTAGGVGQRGQPVVQLVGRDHPVAQAPADEPPLHARFARGLFATLMALTALEVDVPARQSTIQAKVQLFALIIVAAVLLRFRNRVHGARLPGQNASAASP